MVVMITMFQLSICLVEQKLKAHLWDGDNLSANYNGACPDVSFIWRCHCIRNVPTPWVWQTHGPHISHLGILHCFVRIWWFTLLPTVALEPAAMFVTIVVNANDQWVKHPTPKWEVSAFWSLSLHRKVPCGEHWSSITFLMTSAIENRPLNSPHLHCIL